VGAGSVFSLTPRKNGAANYVKVVPRILVRIDFDASKSKDFVHRFFYGFLFQTVAANLL
jgi:multidrug resistance efflux pump